MRDLKDSLIQISREAGEKILEIYNDPQLFEKIDTKADDSPLTLADRSANSLIVEQLSSLTPEIPILSEEGKNIPYSERSSWTKFWLVDPLDGTKEFIKRNGEFTVNIALIDNQRPVMGVVHVPVTNTTYFADKDQGAWMIKDNEPAERIEAQPFNMEHKGLRIVCSRSHMSEEVEQYVNQFEQPELVSMGSSLKFMVLAEGKADIYPRLAPTMEWDTGAAQIIVEEAGGIVIDNNTQQPLQYNKEVLRNPYFIAFGKRDYEDKSTRVHK